MKLHPTSLLTAILALRAIYGSSMPRPAEFGFACGEIGCERFPISRCGCCADHASPGSRPRLASVHRFIDLLDGWSAA